MVLSVVVGLDSRSASLLVCDLGKPRRAGTALVVVRISPEWHWPLLDWIVGVWVWLYRRRPFGVKVVVEIELARHRCPGDISKMIAREKLVSARQ